MKRKTDVTDTAITLRRRKDILEVSWVEILYQIAEKVVRHGSRWNLFLPGKIADSPCEGEAGRRSWQTLPGKHATTKSANAIDFAPCVVQFLKCIDVVRPLVEFGDLGASAGRLCGPHIQIREVSSADARALRRKWYWS